MSIYQCFCVFWKNVKNKIFDNEGHKQFLPKLWLLHLYSTLYFFFQNTFLHVTQFTHPSWREEKAACCYSSVWRTGKRRCRELALAWPDLVVREPGIESQCQQWMWGCPVHRAFSGICLAFARTCLYRVFSFIKWNLLDSLIYLCYFYLTCPLTCHFLRFFYQYGRYGRGKRGLYMSVTTFDWQEFSDASKRVVSTCWHFWKLN